MDEIIRLEDYGMTEWSVMLHDRVITRFKINEGARLIIGRGADADVVIDNTAISRHHTALELKNGVHFITDLRSLNGTTVNGRKISGTMAISQKDKIGIGKFSLVLAPATGEETAPASFAMPMDMDDETVFVSSPAPAAPGKAPNPEKTKHTLTVIGGDGSPKTLSLQGKTNVKIGKDLSCDLVVNGWLVAKAQCYIVFKKDKFHIIPQNSWASTRLNDVAIKQERVLRPGDTIEIRSVKIKFT